MRNERKITVKLLERGEINNTRLVEFLANKFNERGVKNGRV